MNFDNYEFDPAIYAEMFEAPNQPRGHSRNLHQALQAVSPRELGTVQEDVTRSFSTEGITFTVYGDDEASERIIPVDCLPRILPGSDWEFLERGLSQRLAAINLFLADVYSDGRIIADGVIPVDMVRGCPQYRTELRGFAPPHGT